MAWQAWLAPYTPFPHFTQIPVGDTKLVRGCCAWEKYLKQNNRIHVFMTMLLLICLTRADGNYDKILCGSSLRHLNQTISECVNSFAGRQMVIVSPINNVCEKEQKKIMNLLQMSAIMWHLWQISSPSPPWLLKINITINPEMSSSLKAGDSYLTNTALLLIRDMQDYHKSQFGTWKLWHIWRLYFPSFDKYILIYTYIYIINILSCYGTLHFRGCSMLMERSDIKRTSSTNISELFRDSRKKADIGPRTKVSGLCYNIDQKTFVAKDISGCPYLLQYADCDLDYYPVFCLCM